MPVNTLLRVLFIGDIVGKGGRAAVKALLPKIRQEYTPDLIIANAENMAHGNGITHDTVAELEAAGIDFFTSGNHVWDNKNGVEYLKRTDAKVLRPANLPAINPGKGWVELEVLSKKVLLINLIGQVFMPQAADHLLACLDQILTQHPPEQYQAVIVDLHAEATSEKQALAWYGDGRISLVAGTHTHVPTADLRILPNGTGLVCDVGSVGAADSVIGTDKSIALHRFITQTNVSLSPIESGTMLFNAILAEIDPVTRKTLRLQRVDRQIEV